MDFAFGEHNLLPTFQALDMSRTSRMIRAIRVELGDIERWPCAPCHRSNMPVE